MTAKVLVDTNVLVYAYDRAAPAKQRQALAVLSQLADSGVGVLTTQVLAEFFVVTTRKLATPLSVADACVRIEHYLLSWPIIDLTAALVLEAARGVRDHQLSFWDAQIWAAAKLNQVAVIFSEDFNSGAALEGVRFVDPFADDFVVSEWP